VGQKKKGKKKKRKEEKEDMALALVPTIYPAVIYPS
jgi:hypothetical protein